MLKSLGEKILKPGDLVLISDKDLSPPFRVVMIISEDKYPQVGYLVRTLVGGKIREVLREDVIEVPIWEERHCES